MNNTRIIYAPYLRAAKTRLRDGVLTTVMWLLYGYLWLPVISLAAWFLGIDFAYSVMVKAGGAEALSLILGWFSLAVLMIILLVASWSAVQRNRFRGKNRRGLTPSVSDAAIREHCGLSEDAFHRLRTGHRLLVSVDDEGELLSVKPASDAVAA